MRGTPQDWEVVLLGAWNVAILTPRGIARRLFELDEGTQIGVFVPLEGMALIQVVYDAISITPSSQRLAATPQICSGSKLAQSCTILERALRSLPETPVSAAGVNFRFTFPEAPSALVAVFDSPLNDLCADADLSVRARKCRWTIDWNGGELNFEIEHSRDGSGSILMNFHLTSSVCADLTKWIGQNASMLSFVTKMLRETLKVEVEDVSG